MTDKQRTFGQYETPPDVADLLLSFCLRRPNDRLLDPSCGTGAFLARAEKLQGWLASGTPAPNTLWGVELDPESAAAAQNSVPSSFIINRNFFELLPWLDQPFDALIGNPPYTRAEWFGRIEAAQGTAQQLTIFGEPEPPPSSETGAPNIYRQEVLNNRAGLHAHFLVYGTQFIREGGRLGFVVPNSWLDVAYGERLKRFLLEHYKILALIESDVERWFHQAKVNTCLLILEKSSDAEMRRVNRVRLCRLLQPLHKLIHYGPDDRQRLNHLERLTTRLLPSTDSEREDYSIRVVTQGDLASEEKWGIVMRAPVVYRQKSREASFHPLESWAVVERGFTTGANAFFYLDGASIERWAIEPEFRRPVLKTLRSVTHRTLTEADCDHQVLYIDPTVELENSAAAEYVAWGMEQGFHERRTCANRRQWYSLPHQEEASVILAKGIWQRHFAPILVDPIMVDQQIYLIRLADGINPYVAGALLNSAWFAMQLELHGRINFGQGVLWLAAYELEELLLPDPRYLSDGQLADLAAAFESIVDLPVENIQDELNKSEWVAFNDVVADILGFSTSEREGVNLGLVDRISIRRQKAETVN